jgi:hypothetical protein
MDLFQDAPIHDNSKKIYHSRIAEWSQFMPTHFQSVTHIIMLPELSMKALHTHLKTNTPSTRHMYIVAILSFIKHHFTHLSQCITPEITTSLREQWNAIHTHNEAPIIQLRLENKPTFLQQAKAGSQLSFQQIMEIREQLPIGSIERLLISMYTLIPPVRADYFALEIIRDDQDPVEPNYLRIRRGEMETVLTDFKTAKTYHQILNVLPDPLAQEIHASLLQSPRQYLFVNAHGKPHTRNSFTLWTRRILTRVLQVDFTLVFFRHAFATHFVSHHNPTDLQISEVSKKMGHSSEMFRAYRWVTAGNNGDSIEESEEDS